MDLGRRLLISLLFSFLLGLALGLGPLWAGPLELGAVRAYQRWLSPVAGIFTTCRFRPTCSVYALRALEREGFWRANARIAARLLRCSPLGLLMDS